MDSSDSESSASKKPFICTIPGCKASFSKNSKLVIHIRKHTGERPFICDEPGCDKTYTNSSHLRRHKKASHEDKTMQTVVCDYEGCGAVLAHKHLLKKHYNCKHNPDQYPFKCSECSQGFHRKRDLQQHIYLHTGEAAFSCDKCDMSFTTSRNLSKHKRSHRVYNCDCGEIFHRWSLLLAHKKLCKKSRFVCDICNKTFSHLGNFKDHLLVHMNQREKLVFMCPYTECKRLYFHKRNLKYHIDNFHKRINENQSFKCTYPKCQIILKSKQSLKMHLLRHFQWKKKRQIRRDKGQPKAKKPMASILVGEDSYLKNNTFEDDTKMVQQSEVTENPICISEEVDELNDPLLQQCDLTLRLLNEKLITAS